MPPSSAQGGTLIRPELDGHTDVSSEHAFPRHVHKSALPEGVSFLVRRPYFVRRFDADKHFVTVMLQADPKAALAPPIAAIV